MYYLTNSKKVTIDESDFDFAGITYAADGLAYCIMTHLLWPTRSEQYFLLATSIDSGNDELEVYNEAPHILNSHVTSPTETESPQFVKLIDFKGNA